MLQRNSSQVFEQTQSCAIGSSLDKIMGDFWIIVVLEKPTPDAFIMLPSEVKRDVHRGEKDGRVSYWLQPASYDTDEYR
jgi:hypothetical protein